MIIITPTSFPSADRRDSCVAPEKGESSKYYSKITEKYSRGNYSSMANRHMEPIICTFKS